MKRVAPGEPTRQGTEERDPLGDGGSARREKPGAARNARIRPHFRVASSPLSILGSEPERPGEQRQPRGLGMGSRPQRSRTLTFSGFRMALVDAPEGDGTPEPRRFEFGL